MSYNLLGKLAAYRGRQSTKAIAWSSARVARAAATVLPALASGCLTEFPPLLQSMDAGSGDPKTTGGEETPSTGTASSGAVTEDGGPGLDGSIDGSDGTASAPSTDSGTSSPTDGTISCGEGEVACGSGCQRGNSCCDSACEAPNAETACRDGECVIAACAGDFFDCDGEYDNGCELAMPSMSAPDATEDAPFEIPRFDFDRVVEEIEQSAWEGVARYNLNRPCTTCESDGPPEEPDGVPVLVNRGASPASSDLRGSFAMAWNELGLWVNVVVIDDQWVTADEVGETGAQLHDNVMVVWDSAAGESDTGSGDDRLLFAGIDGELTDWRQTSFREASMRVLGTGQCRSIHLNLGGDYLFNGSGGSGSFEVGDRHGLNIGYNDFDLVTEDATSAERQHLVFGLKMTFTSGRDYFTGVRTLPQVELVEGP